MKSGEKLCLSIEKFVNCSCDIDKRLVQVTHIDPHFSYILEYKKVRLINFKTNFNAMSFEARRIFLYPFIACKFLIVINYTTPLYYFDRYQGAST